MAKRQGQWFGGGVLQTVLAGAAVAQVVQLLPTVTAIEAPRDIVAERTIISFQTRRLNFNNVSALAYVVWRGKVASGTSTPLESLDPLSQSGFEWAEAQIMHYGPLEVPEVLVNGFTGAEGLSRRVTAEQVEVVVKRKVARANEGIFLAVTCDVSSVVSTNITWRTYYTYA